MRGRKPEYPSADSSSGPEPRTGHEPTGERPADQHDRDRHFRETGRFLDQLQQTQPRAVLISGISAAPDRLSRSLADKVALTLSMQAFFVPTTGAPSPSPSNASAAPSAPGTPSTPAAGGTAGPVPTG